MKAYAPLFTSLVALIGAVVAYPPPAAAASHCAHVAQRSTVAAAETVIVRDLLLQYLKAVNPKLTSSVAAQGVMVSHSFREGAWTVFRVSTAAGDLEPALLFVNRKTSSSTTPYIWGGTAMLNERADIITEIMTHNEGIGTDLTACVVDFILGKRP